MAGPTGAVPRLGTATLRPRAGRILPRELRPRAVFDQAAALDGGVDDPGFARLLRRIDGSYYHHAPPPTVFTHGEAAFAAAREAIAEAEQEVLLESYIVRDDRTGREFLELLAHAAARKVTIRVLSDAFGSWGTKRSYWRELARRGIDVRLYHRFWRYPWKQFVRDHRKILVVDRRIAFTGGMNIGDEYGSPRYRQGPTWRDTQIRLEGSAALELAAVFREGWIGAGGSSFELPAIRPDQGSDARVLVLDARPGRGHAESGSVFSAIAGGARRRLWITNAYFAPPSIAIDFLSEAVQRGVDVRLMLPGRSDVPLLRHAAHGSYRRLLEHGVRVFEYQPTVLHAKTLVADDCLAAVGSTNLDFRSFRFNAECNAVVLDRLVAADVADAFADDQTRSIEITQDTWSRSIAHRWGDALARRLSPLL